MCLQLARFVFVFCLVPLTLVPLHAANQSNDDTTAGALAFFQALLARGADVAVRELRRPPLDANERKQVLASLPKEGALVPTKVETQKLLFVTATLRFHGLDGVTIVVIDVPQAFLGLHGRAVLLVSRPALRLLSGPELRAMTAHEVGHDFFWAEYARASHDGNRMALRELELRCDGVAALTLISQGLDPATLGNGATKLTQFNRALGADANADKYPPPDVRLQFVRTLARLASQERTRSARPSMS